MVCRRAPASLCPPAMAGTAARLRCPSLRLAVLLLSALAPRAGGAGAASVLVCIPTLARRGGQNFLPQVMAAVQSESREGLQVQIMLMHEPGGAAPPGADFYVPRPEPNVSAPCSFLLWRRRLLADFMHLMREALLRTSPDDVDYIMWLEDDALLAAGWSAAVLDGSAATTCMTALHKCNCHSCDGAGNYNGVGMVASLFHRRQLEALLQQMATMHPSPFSGVRALDTLVYELCKARPDRGPAVFRLPPAAVHLGDIVVTSTKPVPDARVNITWPVPGDVVPRPIVGRKPLVVYFTLAGLVYDAEYAWTINLSTSYEQLVYPKASYKVSSPLSEELCSDAPEWTLKFEIQSLTMPWGAHEDLVIGIDVFEEESEDATRVATGLRAVTVMDQSHVGPYQAHPDEIATSIFFRAPACAAGETAEFLARVHGLAHAVRYGLLVMVLSGANKMHVNESVLEVLEESVEVDARESYSRYLSLQLPKLPAGDYTIRLSVLDMFQLWNEDFERGPEGRKKDLLDSEDRTRELMVSTMVQNLHVQEAVTRSASSRVGREPEEGLGQDAMEQFNQEGLVQDTIEQVDEEEGLGQDAMEQVDEDAQAEWQEEWVERIEKEPTEEGGGVHHFEEDHFEEVQMPEEPSRSDSASATGVCSSDAAAASFPSSAPSAPSSSTLSPSSPSTSAADTTIVDGGRSSVSDDEEWVVQATRWEQWGWASMFESLRTCARRQRYSEAGEDAVLHAGHADPIFDFPVYVLNLPWRQDRRRHSASLLLRVGFSNFSFPVVTIKDEMDIGRLQKLGLVAEDSLQTLVNESHISTEASAKAYLAHTLDVLAIVGSARADGHDMFGIFEDDLNTVEWSLPKVQARLRRVLEALPPTADLLHLEMCYETCSLLRYGSSNKIARAAKPVCSGAILVTRKGAARLQQLCTPIWHGIDIMLPQLIEEGKLESYVATPPIFFQDGYFGSDAGRKINIRTQEQAFATRKHTPVTTWCWESENFFIDELIGSVAVSIKPTSLTNHLSSALRKTLGPDFERALATFERRQQEGGTFAVDLVTDLKRFNAHLIWIRPDSIPVEIPRSLGWIEQLQGGTSSSDATRAHSEKGEEEEANIVVFYTLFDGHPPEATQSIQSLKQYATVEVGSSSDLTRGVLLKVPEKSVCWYALECHLVVELQTACGSDCARDASGTCAAVRYRLLVDFFEEPDTHAPLYTY